MSIAEIFDEPASLYFGKILFPLINQSSTATVQIQSLSEGAVRMKELKMGITMIIKFETGTYDALIAPMNCFRNIHPGFSGTPADLRIQIL